MISTVSFNSCYMNNLPRIRNICKAKGQF